MTRTALITIAAITAITCTAVTAEARGGAVAIAQSVTKACASNPTCTNSTRRLGAWLRRKAEMAADNAADGMEAVGSAIEAMGNAPPASLKKVDTIGEPDARAP